MQRDFIVVAGMQGCGKSTWTELYTASKSRLLCFDPKAVHRGVDFTTPPEDYIPAILDGELTQFRFGTYLPEEVELFGSTAFAAQKTCFLLEECATLFDKGESLRPWARPLVFMGREPQLDLVLVAQRLVSIPLDVRSQATRIVTFTQVAPADVRALAEMIGGEASQLPELPRYECLDWQLGEGISRYRVVPAG